MTATLLGASPCTIYAKSDAKGHVGRQYYNLT